MLLKEDAIMKFHMKGWALAAAVALVVSIASTAMAIESFQERFEWGDMSKPHDPARACDRARPL
jgi:hypothetical protein